MEEEIDLRPYILALIHHWKWIFIMAFVLAIVSFGLSSLLPSTYEATSLIAITSSRDVLQLDARIREVDEQQPSRAYPELAVSDELLQNVLAQLALEGEDIETLSQLRGMLEARLGNDIQLLILTARASTPREATAIANIWAEQFVAWANDIYGTQNGTQVPYFENQLAFTQIELEAAESALVDFQSRNNMQTISNTLRIYAETQANHLETLQTLQSILPDAQRFQARLMVDEQVAESDQYVMFLWHVRAFGTQSSKVSSVPVIMQLDDMSQLTGQGRVEQIDFLDDLISALMAKSDEVGEQLADLEPRILELQRQLQELQIEQDQLKRKRTLAEETYTVLSYKLTEERVITQEVSRGVRLASRASFPENPIGPQRLLITVVGGFLGFAMVIFVVLVNQWWSRA